MAWVAVGVAGGTFLAGAYGAYANQQATDQATAAQEQAANQSAQIQAGMFNTEQSNLAPYRTAGQSALNQLNAGMMNNTRAFTAQDFQTDPGYQFALQQGESAMEHSAAAQGLLHSTNTLENLNNYAQGQADQQYQNSYNRFMTHQQQNYNMLYGAANMGESAAANTNVAAGNAANGISQAYTASGNAISAGDIASGNNTSSLLGSMANSGMQYALMNNIYGKKS